jgi:hypothetical protein
MEVATASNKSPHKSTRKGSSELKISRTSYQRVLKHLKLKPHRPRLLHALHEDDPDRRVAFCEWYLIRHEGNPDFSKSVLWTDGSCFKLNEGVNRHSCVYWSDTNPHEIIQEELYVPGVTVWAGIWSQGILGPYFF